MKTAIAILLLASLVFGQLPAKPKSTAKTAPRLGFAKARDANGLIDTDVLDEQKYIEGAGADSSAVQAKRATHETLLMREFMAGFNEAKECDKVVLLGDGDNQPDFALHIMVDSHDTPGQKPVWAWVVRNIHTDKLMPVGNDDSAKLAASHICMAVANATNQPK